MRNTPRVPQPPPPLRRWNDATCQFEEVVVPLTDAGTRYGLAFADGGFSILKPGDGYEEAVREREFIDGGKPDPATRTRIIRCSVPSFVVVDEPEEGGKETTEQRLLRENEELRRRVAALEGKEGKT